MVITQLIGEFDGDVMRRSAVPSNKLSYSVSLRQGNALSAFLATATVNDTSYLINWHLSEQLMRKKCRFINIVFIGLFKRKKFQAIISFRLFC